MKEININGAFMKCYPLCAAQRLHYYTVKYSPEQVLCIGTGLYVKQDVDFNILKKAIYEAYKKFDTMRLRFTKDEDGTVYQYIVPNEDRDIEFRDFSNWKEDAVKIHFFPLRTIMEPDLTFLDGIRIIQTEQNKIFRHANYDPIEYTMKRGQYWKYKPGTSYESISLTYQPLTITKDTPEMPDIPYKSYWYSNGVAAQPLYLTVMHRPEDNGLNFNFEYRIDAVTDKEMEYFYYYICRVLFREIEDETRTIGEILDMI